jgi:hypothetical protein
MKPTSSNLTRSDYLLFVVYLLLILLTYLLLHGIYRPDNMDDAWFLSFAHNHIVKGVETDLTFGTTPGGGGFGGVMLFGKTFTHLYGGILNSLGWTKSHAHIISTICIALSAIAWCFLLLKRGLSLRLCIIFGLALLLVEPYFGAANQARPDALSFLLASGAALAFCFHRNIIAGLLSAMAIEIHPVGISALLYIAALFVAEQDASARTWRSAVRIILWLSAGLFIGVLYCYLLHAQHLSLLPKTILHGNTGGNEVNNILFEYFFKTKYFRHIPELIAIVAAAAVFLFKRHYRDTRLVPALFVVCILFTLVIRRPNFMYTIYVYPAFLLLTLWMSEKYNVLRQVAVILLLYLIPQYGLVYAKNRDWSMGRYITCIQEAVPKGTAPVLGRPNDWFAFLDRPFYTMDYRGNLEDILEDEFVLIEDDLYRSGHYPGLTTLINNSYRPTSTVEFDCLGETITVRTLNVIDGKDGEQFAEPYE